MLRTDDRQLPDMAFGFYDRMVVFDHVSKTMFVIATAHVQQHDGRRSSCLSSDAQQRVDQMVDRLVVAQSQTSAAAIFDTEGERVDRLPGQLSNRGVSSRRSRSAWSTFVPATSSRW